MKYLKSYQLFERKGNYQLFHKTSSYSVLKEILKDGYIIAGGKNLDDVAWDMPIRKNVIPNWEEGKFLTISATRNLNYMDLPALELDVEKISDKYKIIPYSENPDFYIDFDDENLKPSKNKNLGKFQNMVRSKSKNAGNAYWRVKTNKNAFDYDIAEEIIITNKLDVGKYVKRIILDEQDYNKSINFIHEKYPNIEVIKIDTKYGKLGYADIKKALKQNKKSKVYQEFETI